MGAYDGGCRGFGLPANKGKLVFFTVVDIIKFLVN